MVIHSRCIWLTPIYRLWDNLQKYFGIDPLVCSRNCLVTTLAQKTKLRSYETRSRFLLSMNTTQTKRENCSHTKKKILSIPKLYLIQLRNSSTSLPLQPASKCIESS